MFIMPHSSSLHVYLQHNSQCQCTGRSRLRAIVSDSVVGVAAQQTVSVLWVMLQHAPQIIVLEVGECGRCAAEHDKTPAHKQANQTGETMTDTSAAATTWHGEHSVLHVLLQRVAPEHDVPVPLQAARALAVVLEGRETNNNNNHHHHTNNNNNHHHHTLSGVLQLNLEHMRPSSSPVASTCYGVEARRWW